MAAAHPRPVRTSRDHGFTLIEMLVVIGLIMLFLGISIGSITRTPRANALVATEQMVADVLRQARHTARSSGAPVVVEIDQGQRTVMGVSQVPLWSGAFETTDLASDPEAVDPDLSVIGGMSGRGVRALDADASHPNPRWYKHELTRDSKLSRRGAGGRSPGFYLSCAARPGAPGGDVSPLVMIGDTDAVEPNSCCGLMLRPAVRTIQSLPSFLPRAGSPPPPPPLNAAPTYVCWELVGWVTFNGGTRVEIGSITNAVTSVTDAGLQITIDTPALSGANDVAGPIMGERWEEYGLMYDGQSLGLYRNGTLIASMPCPGTDYLKGVTNASDFVSVAYGDFQTIVAGSPSLRFFPGTIDDVRVLRLGIDRAATLPNGVTPAGTWRITARPDGRIDTDAPANSGGSPTLTFTLTSAEGENHAEVSITSDGVISSRMVATP
jgi:prepilin-type N-terminal cleavage/methylation domain-containing protein